MKLHTPLWMAVAVLTLYAFLAVFFQSGDRNIPASRSAASAAQASHSPASSPAMTPGIVADPIAPQGYTIVPAVVAPLSPPAPPVDGSLVPGHFSGVSVRHVPSQTGDAAAQEAGPLPGVPEEIITPSGKKLVRVMTDERHAIPLMPTPAR